MTEIVKEHGLLFTAPMVLAQLEGRKDQTRRIVAFSNSITVPQIPRKMWICLDLENAVPGVTSCGVPYLTAKFIKPYMAWPGTPLVRIYPRVQPGHHIWARETWAIGVNALAALDEDDWPIIFRADGTDLMYSIDGKWRSAIHLKRKHSRLVRPVLAVGLQRVQEIDLLDIIAEGAVKLPLNEETNPKPRDGRVIRQRFRDLWESVNGPGAWDRNEWVWPYTMGSIINA